VNGVSTVQDIVDMSALAEFDVYRILYELSTRDLTEVVELTAAAVGDASAVRSRLRWVSGALQLLVIAGAAMGIASVGSNPFTPWRIAASGPDTELLKTYASRNRLERVEEALQAFYLDHGAMPESLQALSAGGYLRPADLRNPWGRPYSYRVDPSAYEISDSPPEGRKMETVAIRHPFSASQRMILEGGAIDPVRPNRP
jgi:hypothetical protein